MAPETQNRGTRGSVLPKLLCKQWLTDILSKAGLPGWGTTWAALDHLTAAGRCSVTCVVFPLRINTRLIQSVKTL